MFITSHLRLNLSLIIEVITTSTVLIVPLMIIYLAIVCKGDAKKKQNAEENLVWSITKLRRRSFHNYWIVVEQKQWNNEFCLFA